MPGDLAVVDVFVNDMIRLVYTTDGDLADGIPPDPNQVVFPGRLRYVDLARPIPNLATGSATAVIPAPVARWNDYLGGDVQPPSPVGDFFGKGLSFQGIVSVNGTLFVSGQIRKDKLNKTPPCLPPDPGNHAAESHHTLWNGLTMLSGTAPPGSAFDPLAFPPVGQELWSAGTGGIGVPTMQEAVPEVVAVGENSLGRWVFVANYCGKDAAGKLLVQNISNSLAVDASQRILVDLYWLLGLYTDSLPQYACGQNAAWPLGSEVPKSLFTQAAGSANYDVRGNKLRPICVVRVRTGVGGPNAGRILLICGLNLDPVEPGTLTPLDLPDDCFPTLDDGRYDWLSITDITYMQPTPNIEPQDSPFKWYFAVPSEWQNRTTFLRLPPDLPPMWNCVSGYTEANSGQDWSIVTIPDPTPGGGSDRQERIVGSGTPTSIVASETGRYAYVTTVDQAETEYVTKPKLHDGGWHVPHLYVIDLAAFDVHSQTSVTAYALSGLLPSYRFNKVIRGKSPDWLVTGAVCVNATIPNFPNSGPL